MRYKEDKDRVRRSDSNLCGSRVRYKVDKDRVGRRE